MKLIAKTLASAAAVATIASAASAQDYPERDLSYIVPYGAGGQTDIASRVFADALAEVLGVSVTVVNRSGAGGSVGTAEIAAADPDGYVVGTTTSTPLIQTPNRTNTPYDLDSFDYICRVYSNPMILVVKNDSEYESYEQLAEAARSGERITYGTVGTGSVAHVAAVELGLEGGYEAVQVQAPADADNVRNLLADVIDFYFVSGSVYKQNSDVLRPLVVLSTEGLEALPDTPTIFDLGGTVQAGIWGAFVAPAGLPDATLTTLRDACREAQTSDSFIETLTGFGMEPVYMDGPETEELARTQFEAAGVVLKQLGLTE